ncbi:F0F1 ATP synthase subunit gamma [Sinirhodobacter sp. WL0062]|uniref:F0F1 ATP synthase subunit gamma n=1 Tax=Rhodobacter flavimaris TaxID=2907145 RepID=A0ABS8YSJ6_9RHOB|nr:F0F1 ATP synthase subunit gamma [Sinirhodobacter sp. WL0062]MCE5972060.1 F0F1 ATP synthase subunit gamma [Sinirhodobacter sp. WL0062]
MSRPEDIKDHLANVQQIESIVGTLRALAAAHQLEAKAHLEAVRAHEATVAAALSTALGAGAIWPEEAEHAGHLSIVIGAAQGFCGAHSDHLAEAAQAEVASGAGLIVVGGRTEGMLADTPLIWAAEMAAHAPQVPDLASRLADAVFEELAKKPGLRVRIVFADPDPEKPGPGTITRHSVFPLDPARFQPARAAAPLTSLPAGDLLGALIEEYVYSELCEALMLGFAAENAARAEAMARAQSNVRRIATDLRGDYQRARQEQMTTEIIELTTAAVG